MRIRRVVDMRTGMEHPTRTRDGRFMRRRFATQIVQSEDRMITESRPDAAWWPITQKGIARVIYGRRPGRTEIH